MSKSNYIYGVIILFLFGCKTYPKPFMEAWMEDESMRFGGYTPIIDTVDMQSKRIAHIKNEFQRSFLANMLLNYPSWNDNSMQLNVFNYNKRSFQKKHHRSIYSNETTLREASWTFIPQRGCDLDLTVSRVESAILDSISEILDLKHDLYTVKVHNSGGRMLRDCNGKTYRTKGKAEKDSLFFRTLGRDSLYVKANNYLMLVPNSHIPRGAKSYEKATYYLSEEMIDNFYSKRRFIVYLRSCIQRKNDSTDYNIAHNKDAIGYYLIFDSYNGERIIKKAIFEKQKGKYKYIYKVFYADSSPSCLVVFNNKTYEWQQID